MTRTSVWGCLLLNWDIPLIHCKITECWDIWLPSWMNGLICITLHVLENFMVWLLVQHQLLMFHISWLTHGLNMIHVCNCHALSIVCVGIVSMEVAFQAWLLGGDQLHMEQTKLLNHIVPRDGIVQLVGNFANSQMQTFVPTRRVRTLVVGTTLCLTPALIAWSVISAYPIWLPTGLNRPGLLLSYQELTVKSNMNAYPY